MFTVVILSNGARRIFDGAKMYFEPFEESGQLFFCEWDQSPSALSLAEILPGLREAIRGKGEWRAIVVESAPATVDPAQLTAPDNPFDYLDNVGVDPASGRSRLLLNLENSKHPLVRVAHALLGYPQMGAKSFERVLRYNAVEEGTGRISPVVLSESDLESQGMTVQKELAVARKDDTKVDVQLQFQDVAYSADEIAQHDELTERYRMRDIRPTEVVFVATRPPVEADPKAELVSAWRLGGARDDVSRFVERNDYPASSRFAVYNLPGSEHSAYEQHVLRFWLSVLSLAVNQLPPSAFQADRLYRLGVGISESALGGVLNAHISSMNAIREHVTRLVRQPARPVDATVEDRVKAQRVHVEFDRLGGDELSVDTGGYQLVADVPRPEGPRWQQEVAHLRSQAETFTRRPRRLLLRSVWEARAKAQSYVPRELELSEIEREEVQDELRARMSRLTRPATADILDRRQLGRIIAENDERIASHLRQRLRLAPTVWTLALALALWGIGLAPYLISASTGPASLYADDLAIAIGVLAVLVLITLGCLIVMRLRLVRMLRDFNAALRDYATRVTSGAALFSDFLSDFATYRYGSALLSGASTRQARDAGRALRLARLGQRLAEQIEAEKRIVISLGEPLAIQRIRVGVADFDPDDEVRVRALFRLPMGEGRAAFNQSGEKVVAPYEFVTSLTVERIRVFEHAFGQQEERSAPDAAAPAGSPLPTIGVR